MVNPIDTTSGINTSQFIQNYKTGDAAFDKGITQLTPAQQAKIGDSVSQSVSEMTTTTPPPAMPKLDQPTTNDFSTPTMSGGIDTANAAAVITQMMNIFIAIGSKNMQSAIKNYAKSLDNALSKAAAQASLQKDQAQKSYLAARAGAIGQITAGGTAMLAGAINIGFSASSLKTSGDSMKAGTSEANQKSLTAEAQAKTSLGQGIGQAVSGAGQAGQGIADLFKAGFQKDADLLGAKITETAAQKDFENQMASAWWSTYQNSYNTTQSIMSSAQQAQQSIQESKRIRS